MKAASFKSPSVHHGKGINYSFPPPPIDDVVEQPKDETTDEEEIYTDPEGNSYILDNLGLQEWSDKAIFKNQFSKPGFWKYGSPVTVIYDFSKSEQLEAYNALLAKTFPATDPGIEIVESDRHFWEGKFICLIKYCQIWYLLPTKK